MDQTRASGTDLASRLGHAQISTQKRFFEGPEQIVESMLGGPSLAMWGPDLFNMGWVVELCGGSSERVVDYFLLGGYPT